MIFQTSKIELTTIFWLIRAISAVIGMITAQVLLDTATIFAQELAIIALQAGWKKKEIFNQ